MKQMKFMLQGLTSRNSSQMYRKEDINYNWLGSLSLLILTFSFITFAKHQSGSEGGGHLEVSVVGKSSWEYAHFEFMGYI